MIIFGVLIIVVSPPPPDGEQPIRFVRQQPIVQERDPNLIYRDCEACGWWGAYETEGKATMGMASHRQWCKKGHGWKPFF